MFCGKLCFLGAKVVKFEIIIFFIQTVFKSGLVKSTKNIKNCSKTLLRYIASG